jgi:hypothetical protein
MRRPPIRPQSTATGTPRSPKEASGGPVPRFVARVSYWLPRHFQWLNSLNGSGTPAGAILLLRSVNFTEWTQAAFVIRSQWLQKDSGDQAINNMGRHRATPWPTDSQLRTHLRHTRTRRRMTRPRNAAERSGRMQIAWPSTTTRCTQFSLSVRKRSDRADFDGMYARYTSSPHGRTRMIVFPGRRSVGLKAATASSRVATVPMFVRSRPSRTR